MANMKHVPGENKGDLKLYALSTCIWCSKVKELLNSLGVEYKYTDVDSLEGKEKEDTKKEIEKWNPSCSFPTLVIDDKTCVVGYDETKIKEALNK